MQGYRLAKPTCIECPEAVYELMQKCWAAVPSQRPSFPEVFETLRQIVAKMTDVKNKERKISENKLEYMNTREGGNVYANVYALTKAPNPYDFTKAEWTQV